MSDPQSSSGAEAVQVSGAEAVNLVSSSPVASSSTSSGDVDNVAVRCMKKTGNTLYHAFNDHPNENGMTYGEHFCHAWSAGFQSIVGGCILLFHGVFTMTFERTGSNIIKGVNHKLTRKIKKQE